MEQEDLINGSDRYGRQHDGGRTYPISNADWRYYRIRDQVERDLFWERHNIRVCDTHNPSLEFFNHETVLRRAISRFMSELPYEFRVRIGQRSILMNTGDLSFYVEETDDGERRSFPTESEFWRRNAHNILETGIKSALIEGRRQIR